MLLAPSFHYNRFINTMLSPWKTALPGIANYGIASTISNNQPQTLNATLYSMRHPFLLSCTRKYRKSMCTQYYISTLIWLLSLSWFCITGTPKNTKAAAGHFNLPV